MIKFGKLMTVFKILTSLYVLFLQNTVIYLHCTHCRIYLLTSPKSNGKIVLCNHHDNILAFKKDNYVIFLDFDFYTLFF